MIGDFVSIFTSKNNHDILRVIMAGKKFLRPFGAFDVCSG
jgi:hypothetical protein